MNGALKTIIQTIAQIAQDDPEGSNSSRIMKMNTTISNEEQRRTDDGCSFIKYNCR